MMSGDIQIRDFHAGDLDLFDFSEFGEYTEETIRKMASQAEMSGSVTVYDGDIPVAFGGIITLWHGVGEAWTIFSRVSIGYWPGWKVFHRQAQKMIAEFFNNGGHRLQTSVQREFEQGEKWVERLGFLWEGYMPQYGPDGSHFSRWAIVK